MDLRKLDFNESTGEWSQSGDDLKIAPTNIFKHGHFGFQDGDKIQIDYSRDIEAGQYHIITGFGEPQFIYVPRWESAGNRIFTLIFWGLVIAQVPYWIYCLLWYLR